MLLVRADGMNWVLKEQDITARFIRECERLDVLRHEAIIRLQGIFYANEVTANSEPHSESLRGCLIMPYYQRGCLRRVGTSHVCFLHPSGRTHLLAFLCQ